MLTSGDAGVVPIEVMFMLVDMDCYDVIVVRSSDHLFVFSKTFLQDRA